MRHSKRYRGRKPGTTYRTICRTISALGLLMALTAGGSDIGIPLWHTVALIAIGIFLFGVFGALGGLFR